MHNLEITARLIAELRPYSRNARTHSKRQIQQLARSIERFGWTNPVLISDDDEIIAGHGRVEAARLLGLTTVPVVRLSHLSEGERRAYVIADNRLAEKAGWDRDILAIELQGLIDLKFDVQLTGFAIGEIDIVLQDAASKSASSDLPEDDIPPEVGAVTSRLGDLWTMGHHRLLCGNALDPGAYAAVLAGRDADLVFTDPPYNVPISGHVSGLGRTAHPEFVMASGEMDEEEFTRFLKSFLANSKRAVRAGAILFVCMDWRHLYELFSAGRACQLELKNLCVWNKANGGMGSFYRSKHELVAVYKSGDVPHTNTVELGQHGRYRTNVWDYAGVNTFRSGRAEELAMHPTVKPVGLVADAIRDASRHQDLVLDPFAGSGTTIIAAEKTGRRARAIELDPRYVDVAVRRWEAFTGRKATLGESARTFEDIAEERSIHDAPTPVES
jgi:DNA modification methylase